MGLTKLLIFENLLSYIFKDVVLSIYIGTYFSKTVKNFCHFVHIYEVLIDTFDSIYIIGTLFLPKIIPAK